MRPVLRRVKIGETQLSSFSAVSVFKHTHTHTHRHTHTHTHTHTDTEIARRACRERTCALMRSRERIVETHMSSVSLVSLFIHTHTHTHRHTHTHTHTHTDT